jgi:phosphonate transport system substrate-binding protein
MTEETFEMRKTALLALLLAFALVAAACGSSDDTTTTTAAAAQETTTTAAPATTTTAEEAMPDLGTAENPIKVLFVPSVDAQVITSGGEIMAAELKEATGFEYEVVVPTSYAATAEEMCAAPDSTIGFIPGLLYVLATDLCGVDVSFKAIRFGNSVYWSQILVPRDSTATSLEDLQGLTWAYSDAGSTSSFMVPTVMWEEDGIEFAETVEAGSHNAAALAVYNGEADVGTTFYTPPLNTAEGGDQWSEGDPPDIPDDLVDSCAITEEDRLFCGDLRVLDARASVRTEAPDIVQKVRVLAISPAIPNDTLSFGSEFPADIRTAIEEALLAWVAECEDAETGLDCSWSQSIGHQDFYNWTGIARANDSEYDFIRLMVEAVGYDPTQ